MINTADIDIVMYRNARKSFEIPVELRTTYGKPVGNIHNVQLFVEIVRNVSQHLPNINIRL